MFYSDLFEKEDDLPWLGWFLYLNAPGPDLACRRANIPTGLLPTLGDKSSKIIYTNAGMQFDKWIRDLANLKSQRPQVRKLANQLADFSFKLQNPKGPIRGELFDYFYTKLALQAELGHWRITEHLWSLGLRSANMVRELKLVSGLLKRDSMFHESNFKGRSKSSSRRRRNSDGVSIEAIINLTSILHQANGEILVYVGGTDFEPAPFKKLSTDQLAVWFAFRIREIMNKGFGSYGVLETIFPLLQGMHPIKPRKGEQASPKSWSRQMQASRLGSRLQKAAKQQLKSAYPRLFK